MKKLSVISVALSVALMGSCTTGGNIGKGDKKFARGEFESAIKYYQEAVNKGNDVDMANFKIAEAYRMSNRLQQAEPYYKAAIDAGIKKEEAFFFYGMALKANEKYEEAQSQLQNYLTMGTNREYVNRARMEVNNLGKLDEIRKSSPDYEVRNLENVNTPAAEYAPVMRNGELVFTSGRGGKTYAGNGEGFTDLYVLKFDDPATMSGGTAQPFSSVLNKEEVHDAAATFAHEGRTVVYARGNSGSKKGTLDVDLLLSREKAGVWAEPKMASINDAKAWDSSPAFSPDGTTLYFSSNRRGGQGGNDIWKTTLDANGRFSTPVNLGAEINTPGDESFPFVDTDGTLYFSSNGHAGFGMLDLFKVEGGKAVNLGPGINSSADDFGIYFTGEGTGLFSSSRAGGKGSDDIYAFEKSKRKMVTFYVDGKVMLKKNKAASAEPAENIKVKLLDAQENKLEETTADATGNFSFKLDTAATYSLLAEKDGYFAARQTITTVGKMPAQSELQNKENDVRFDATLTLNEIVKDVAIKVDNIFYDYNSAEIRPDAAQELDKLVQTLKDNPKITIELSSHTDARGKDAYNLELSQRRAQSAVDYIISQGIDKSRITAKGYGETKPVVKNAKTEEQHQLNRRTEFKVTKIAQ
ncbi:MAG: OmpA family protein [Hymenobacteraceae bacterium]|nr:OmpA family protein [Hymenobacteraceae bacterium]MDX5396509.1 OmpA family protein [Hymenobacteraceae bacterium]MDX5442721.1 OmpA family protein [Hymenobacteraceae bacterium]MDX5512576.1 OmpA family protein [Hymenobacteraceae bacterium]